MAGPPVHSGGEKPDASSRCRAQECCKRRPFFGPPGGKPLFCAQHSKKSEGMVDVSSRRCEHEGCAKWPLYGNEGQKAKFCSMHKEPTMIDVRSRRCAAPGCKRQPSYGFEGSRACFCAAHKEPGMVDVVSRRCEGPHCRRRPLYGFEGQKSQFCSAHKQEGQVDVCNRRCQQQGCSKRPCFGFPGQRPIFCGTHRTSDMVDVISHKCSYPGCSHPTGYEANRIRSKFCDKHRSVGLAGASLLQLAGSAVDGNSAGTRPTDSVAHRPGSPSPKKSTSRTKVPGSQTRSMAATDPKKGDTSELEGATKGNKIESMHKSETASSASSGRLSNCAAPPKGAKQASMLEDMLTHSATPLPPLGSILQGSSSKGRSKRPREGDGKSRDDAHVNQSPPEPPPVPGEGDFSAEAPSVANDAEFGDSTKPTGERAEIGSGGADGSRRCGSSGGGSHAPNVLCDKPEYGLSDASEDSEEPKPSRGAKRLFPGSPKDLLGWGRAWEGTRGTDHAGFLSSTLSPDWRSNGLAFTGRAVSFDEMQAAAGCEVIEPDREEQPRRASAFVVGTDVLSPVVTEVGRRESALEPGATYPAKSQISHYRDLLSAGQQFRSGLSSASALPRRLSKQGAVAEGEEEASGSGVATLSSRSRGASSGLWTPSSPNEWISWENVENSRLEGQPAPSRRAKLFHVMSPATPFMGEAPGGGSGDGPRLGILQKRTAYQKPEQQASGDQTGAGNRRTTGPGKIDGSVDPAGAKGVDLETGSKTTPSKHRRRSLMESSSHSPWSRTHQGGEEVTTEGAVSTPSGRGTLGKQSPCFGGLGDAEAEAPHRLLPLRRASKLGASQDVEATMADAVDLRRRSLPALDGASTLDEGNGAPPIAFVPAWGAPVGDDQNHDIGLGENAMVRETPAAPAIRPNRPSGRRGALFGVEREGAERVRRGLGALFGGTRRHPSSVPSPGKRKAPGSLSQRRGWGPLEQDSVPPPETLGLVNRYVLARGSPVEEGRQDSGDQNKPGTQRSCRGDEVSSFSSADGGHERRRSVLGVGEDVAGVPGCPAHTHPGAVHPGALTSSPGRRRALALGLNPQNPPLSRVFSGDAFSVRESHGEQGRMEYT